MTGRKAGRGGACQDEDRVIFPCELPQWARVEEELELLLDNWVGAGNIATRLDNLHHIAQGHEGSDQRVLAVFRGLGQFLPKMEEEERRVFHQVALPSILRRALQLPALLADQDDIPLLLQHKVGRVVLPRQLVASIVACSFLCLFPGTTPKQSTFNTINFVNFFPHLNNEPQQAKLRCILHYFERLAADTDGPPGNITVTRKVLEKADTHDLDWWQQTDIPLCPLLVHTEGFIEDTPHPSVQVDFANKKIGGGVLGTGRVQEEIRFVTCPELVATMLIAEAMDENEALWVEGFETYSAHEGYAKTLRYAGDFKDTTPVDSHGNLRTMVCAIDALTGASQRQYQDKFILREVNKAFIGFLQRCSDRTAEEKKADVERYSARLTEDIITTAAHQAALVLTQSRLQEHAVPPSASGDRSHKDRCDSSDTSSDSLSHHSTASFGIGEGERSWMMGMRRRSSNLSDVGSRRSSDLTTSRRSSGSTRYSSDLSSDLEELYETFQHPEARQRPAAIKEEVPHGAVGIQDFVSSMVSDVMDEGSNLAAQMMPGVQNFGETQPLDVAKPKAYKPPAPGQDLSFDFPLDLDSSSDSSNQTDDQKAKENIVRFVSQLVEKAFVGAGSGPGAAEEEGAGGGAAAGASVPRDMDHLHLHHSWSSSDSGGSPLYHHHHHLDNVRPVHNHQEGPSSGVVPVLLCYGGYDRGRRLSHPLDSHPHFSPPVDVVQQQQQQQRSNSHRGSSHYDSSPRSSINEGSPRSSHMDVSPRMPQFDGSPRAEATAMWRHQEVALLNEVARMSSSRRRSSTDFAGSIPSLDNSRQQMHPEAGPSSRHTLYAGFADSLQHRDSWASAQHGESLTDDLKEAVANSASAFQAVQAAAALDHSPYPHVADIGPERPLAESRLSAFDARLRGNLQSKSDTSLLTAQHTYHPHTYQRQDSVDAEWSPEGAVGYSPSRLGPGTAVAVAGQIVQASLETAVRTATQQAQAVGGMAQWRNQQRREYEAASHASHRVNFGRSLSLNKPRRKGSMDENLSSFAHSLARHGSLGELSCSRYQQRRGSSGFRDSVLSSFADQLLDTSNNVADPAWLDLRRHSLGGERTGLFRRGSADSRGSSISRHSSTDILFPACSTPEEPPPWGMNRGRRSSREIVLDLLTPAPTSSVPQQRKRQSTLTSHLDWFVQDLLMESFNGAFIQLFGQDYLESYDYQRRQPRKRSRSRSSHSGDDRQLLDFADAFVQDIIYQAIDKLKEEEKLAERRRRAPSEEEEEGSNYEDALDIPFQMLETFATSLAGNVMETAKVEVVRRQQLGPHVIATGNWGCGAFRGNPQMKVLLQWAAASCAGAPAVHYYTFKSPDLLRLPEVIESVRRRGWNVGHILQYVVQYARQRRYTSDDTIPSLFDMLLRP